MRFFPLILGLVFCLSFSLAQSTISGTLFDVRVEGSSENETLIKTVIRSRKGTDVDQINLESERNLVLSLGLFSEVKVSLEAQPSGPILVIRVKENPRIAGVRVEGSTILSEQGWLEGLSRNLIEPGLTFNSSRAEEAIPAIQQAYRQRGFPFDVPVSLEVNPVSPAEDADETDEAADTSAADAAADEVPVELIYTVTETAPIRNISFLGATALEEDELEAAFRGLDALGEFSVAEYDIAVGKVGDLYREDGYRGSGVNIAETNLVDGQLSVVFRELKVISLDTTAIGVSPSELSLEVGDLFNYDVLLNDVRRLAEGRDSDISLEFFQLSTGDVRVSFLAGPPGEAGEITSISIEGNTVIPTEDILEVLELREGENFTSTLAAEDFALIQQLYSDRGYSLANTPAFNYLDGVYSQRLVELKIAGYNVRFDKPDPKSEEFILTRYLPKPGSVLNQESLRRGLLNALRLGAFEVTNAIPIPAENPDEVIIQIDAVELPTGLFQPGLNYETSSNSSEFFASIVFSDTNFLGRAHNISAEVKAQTSDVGFMLGGNVSYSIPWIYIDELDFRSVPTRISASLFSDVTTNQVMNADGRVRVCLGADGSVLESCDADDTPGDDGDRQALVGEYTKRETGLGFGIGRQVLPFTNLGFSARGGYSEYKLENGTECEFNADGTIENAETCALPRSAAEPFLPQSGLSALLSVSLEYDDRDNVNFPREGVHANGRVGLGFGSDYRNSEGEQSNYLYSPLEFGVRTYVQLADFIPDLNDPNHVLAFKATAGHQFGEDYPTNRYFVVGDSFVNDTLIRGYRRADINSSQTYAIGTIEYRYDFNLDTVATQTIIALAFADVGWASSVPGSPDYGGPILAGGGVGVQVNLGLGGFIFPAIRMDYSFSAANPTGIFKFRLGPVF